MLLLLIIIRKSERVMTFVQKTVVTAVRRSDVVFYIELCHLNLLMKTDVVYITVGLNKGWKIAHILEQFLQLTDVAMV